MKLATLAFLPLMAVLLPPGANALPLPTVTAGPTVHHTIGLSWRCGKNNPAMWGTFGNGCLKQKRAFKAQQKNGASKAVPKLQLKRR